MPLTFVNRRLQHFPFRGVPEAVVNQFGISGHQLVLEMSSAAVERDLFNSAMCLQQDRAAGRLIDAPRLHADKPVLDEVQATDSVPPAEFIEPCNQARRAQPLAVDCNRIALTEFNVDQSRFIRSCARIDGSLIDMLRGLHCGVFEQLALRRSVKKIGVDRKRRFPPLVLGNGDLVQLGKLQKLGSAGEIPFPPWAQSP